MAFPILLLVAAAIPDVPAAVQIVSENQTYVMRSADEAKPLYSYDKDAPGKSSCNDQCAAAWPPLLAPAGARPVGKWTVITRSDGSLQWALEERPVYTFARDANSRATGDGMGGVWHLLPVISAR